MRRTTWTMIVVAALALGTFVLYLVGAIPYKAYVVHTGSMSPAIPSRSAVIVRTGEYHIGQPVTYVVHNTVITHRLESIDADGNITTKGDANRSVDPWHPPKSNIIGGVVAAPRYVGWLLVFLGRTPTGALSILLLLSCFWQSNRFARGFRTLPELQPTTR